MLIKIQDVTEVCPTLTEAPHLEVSHTPQTKELCSRHDVDSVQVLIRQAG